MTIILSGSLGSAQMFAQIPGASVNPLNMHQQLPVRINPPNSTKQKEKRKKALREYNFKQMKKHAESLSELAASLQKEIEGFNENVLSLDIVKKAAQIEKLAKKIKKEAKGR